MASDDSHASAALNLYIYQHLKGKDMHETAEIFRREADIFVDDSVTSEFDITFLSNWWLKTSEHNSSILRPPENNHDQENKMQSSKQEQRAEAPREENREEAKMCMRCVSCLYIDEAKDKASTSQQPARQGKL